MKRAIKSVIPEAFLDKYKRASGRSKEDLELPPSERIKKWGYRKFIGGDDPEAWYKIGKRQYHFLVSRGLQSHHVFLDVACGSLRLGQYLIPMLENGKYFGLEGEKALIDAGINEEMFFDVIKNKAPTFMLGYDFDVRACPGYDFAIAQSLFTHLTVPDIENCFSSLAGIANRKSKFFFTFFEGDESTNTQEVSHANKNWNYRFDTLRGIARSNGFDCEYIGDWGHERNQMMAVATKGPN